jgi:hypothetical protein
LPAKTVKTSKTSKTSNPRPKTPAPPSYQFDQKYAGLTDKQVAVKKAREARLKAEKEEKEKARVAREEEKARLKEERERQREEQKHLEAQEAAEKVGPGGLLQDMMAVYFELGGMRYLAEAIKKDPALRATFVKEMFGIQRRDIENKIKELEELQNRTGRGKGTQKPFQFVIKGLYREGEDVNLTKAAKKPSNKSVAEQEEEVFQAEQDVPGYPNLTLEGREDEAERLLDEFLEEEQRGEANGAGLDDGNGLEDTDFHAGSDENGTIGEEDVEVPVPEAIEAKKGVSAPISALEGLEGFDLD